MKLAYYPGCVSRSTGKEMDRSTRAVCAALGIDLEELPDWSCCGATHVPNEFVSTGLAVRNIIQTDQPIVTACSICYSNLRNAVLRMEVPEVRAKVDAVLTKSYKGARIRHVLDVILEVLQKDDDRLVVPLNDLKAAPYYGCLLTRPKGGIDSPEVPTIMEGLIKTLEGRTSRFRAQSLLLRRSHIHAPGGSSSGYNLPHSKRRKEGRSGGHRDCLSALPSDAGRQAEGPGAEAR